jgi:hypothetical protein
LFGACILETVLIVLFHSSIGQILTMVVLTVGLMFAVVGLLYATDRFQWRSARA